MSIDTKEFRRALGKFATGVTVITARDEAGVHYGVTASSFNSVSMDPPLILWSIDKGAYSLEAYRKAEYFIVNVLGTGQVDISNRFARKGEDKFASTEWSEGIGGTAKIDGANAQFECRTWNVYEGGDHLIIIGEVLDFSLRDGNNALVFYNGRYAVPEPHPIMLPVDEEVATDGRLGKHLLYLLRQALSAYCNDFYPRLSSLGVNDKDWRILTLLADRGPLNCEVLARRVAQPMEHFEDTLSGLCERGLVRIKPTKEAELSDEGQALSQRLLAMADDYESRLLNWLEPDEMDTVKAGLTSVIEHLKGRV
ncbi:flavin reductase [Halomonas sp. McH1-25]|uniref:flavin reductase n=1 Tax=unclassified Halomonas TaxID=2609666 RepID=UPI001EF451A3|nr:MULTISPECIES: flavin reductase [unclassified Halomonas]MCG7602180.1 flavin reductase [Halomonas sp. McH1-25]MCP1344680.1 flavin reductase [Halomonas sp. FL8]MCP1362485.1 flavin reductase [Halomonas sp. BBD45]MCP1365206.1 flavin reductase [Halomonas sp. BBD48]